MVIVPSVSPNVQPGIDALAAFLCIEGYHEHARGVILAHVAEHGTLAGLVDAGCLEPADEAAAERAFVDHLEPVSVTDPAWDEFGFDPGDGPRYSPRYELEDGGYLDRLTDEEIDRMAEDRVDLDALEAPEDFALATVLPPIAGGSPGADDDRYEPTEEDLADYDAHCRADDLLRALLRDEDGRAEADRYRRR